MRYIPNVLEKRLGMTDKELRKLRRQDLLELLVEQSREATRFQSERDGKQAELSKILESYERLKGKLDEKDALIEKLKGRLDEKDALMEADKLEAEETLTRLKAKLDEKDVLLEKLKKRLDQKDEKLEQLEAEVEKAHSHKWKEMDECDFTSEIIAKIKTLF